MAIYVNGVGLPEVYLKVSPSKGLSEDTHIQARLYREGLFDLFRFGLELRDLGYERDAVCLLYSYY